MPSQFFGEIPNNFASYDKPRLRSWLRESFTQAEKNQHYAAQRAQEQTDLEKHLLHFLQGQTGTWTSFRASRQEPQLDFLPQKASHLKWAYPRLEEQTLKFYFASFSVMNQNSLGIWEPPADPQQLCEPPTITGMLVPGLAFSPRGGRLGRGKGHYDRVLSSFKGLKIGICFNEYILTSLPEEDHDVRMDFVVTPLGVISCK